MPDDVLGRGFAFPLLPAGPFATVSGPDAVAQAIRHILFTQPGERVGRPMYGAGLRRFLFAPNTLSTRTRLQQAIADAIRRDEPRVVLQAVDVRAVDGEPTRLDIEVRYTTLGRNVPTNLVFPFYLDGVGA